MLREKIIVLSLFLFVSNGNVFAQACTTLGQNPSTAFPVCGTKTFIQNTVPICSSNNLYVPGCSGTGNADYENKNPFWYRFTCFQSGTLAFVIKPINAGDDYDWQLYDITGRDPDEVYTNPSLVVTGNWSATPGNTGAFPGGVNYIQCASTPQENKPTFAAMPNIIQGHDYLLLVSHFTNSQSGYSLSFLGGSSVITDLVEPHLASAKITCDGKEISVKFNKKMRCNSLTSDGSDFRLSTPLATITGSTSVTCSNSFDMDKLVLTLNNPLPPGNYMLYAKNGSDGNTILDICDRNIAIDDSLAIVVAPIQPTPMDSISKIACSPDIIQLVFKDDIKCSSIAADGSDFSITGTIPVTISAAAGVCNASGLTGVINIKLSAPINRAGTFQIKLKTGSDGNTIISECLQETPAGAALNFTTADTVDASFAYSIQLGCVTDRVRYIHNGNNGVNNWLWNFDNKLFSHARDTTISYTLFGEKKATLIVTNGVCADTSVKTILLDNELKAAFESTPVICPGDAAIFKDKSESLRGFTQWNWDFGNGTVSNQQNPPLQYYTPPAFTTDLKVQLIVQNDIGCFDTVYRMIKIANNCFIAVPKGFSPNQDGLNDYLYPTNAYKAKDLLFQVFNRFGQKMFESTNWMSKWDGTFNGAPQSTGTYVWYLRYNNIETGKKVEQKGYSVLIR